MFEYALDDFLEIKGACDVKKRRPLKEFLLAQALDRLELLVVEGFVLAKNLVVLEPEKPAAIENLVFLRPKDGKIHVTHIKRSR
jgi:hypothetical protein